MKKLFTSVMTLLAGLGGGERIDREFEKANHRSPSSPMDYQHPSFKPSRQALIGNAARALNPQRKYLLWAIKRN